MSINTNLMQQVVAGLKQDKDFVKDTKKLEKYKNLHKKLNKGEITSVATTCLGTAGAVGSAIATLFPNQEFEPTAFFVGAGFFAAGLGGLTLCDKIKEHIGVKNARAYNRAYSKVKDDYVTSLNQQNGNNDYTLEDMEEDIISYQQSEHKVFDIRDFEIEDKNIDNDYEIVSCNEKEM